MQGESERKNSSTLSVGTPAWLYTLVFIVIAFLIVVKAADIMALTILAIIFGVCLERTSLILGTFTNLSYPIALGVLTTLLLLVTAGVFIFSGFQIEGQISKTSRQLRQSGEELHLFAERNPVYGKLIYSLPFISPPKEAELQTRKSNRGREKQQSEKSNDELAAALKPEGDKKETDEKEEGLDLTAGTKDKLYTAVTGIFGSAFGAVVNTFFIFFVGLFFAADPELYKKGLVRLFPVSKREDAGEVINTSIEELWQWSIARAASMIISGIGITISLMLVGSALPVTLGIIAALLTFIPNIGAALSFLVAVLVNIPQGVNTIWLVTGVFVLFQLIESYIITPIIFKKRVSTPPALLLLVQAIMAVFLGFIGAMIASPLLVLLQVLTREVYVERVLENRAEES